MLTSRVLPLVGRTGVYGDYCTDLGPGCSCAFPQESLMVLGLSTPYPHVFLCKV